MKYNQPYGVSDEDAPYINGDPSIGRAGSIPPAASIEYPQREIVNLINAAGLAHLLPDNADLQQLAKAVQSCQLNYKEDDGLTNFYAATMVPNPGLYFDGLTVILKIKNTNTGPAVLNLNGIGNAPVVRTDGTDVVAGDLLAGSMACFIFDDDRAQFQVVWSAAVASGPPGPPGPPGEPGIPGGGGFTPLTGPRTIYVNDATGNDAWDGTVAAFTTDTHGPVKTCQRAADICRQYNMNGYYITVRVAPGTYAKFQTYDVNGSGYISWIGDTANPTVHLFASGGGITVNCGKGTILFDGFKISSAGSDANGVPGWGIGGGGPVFLQKIWFGNCPGGMIVCSTGDAWVGINGPITLEGSGAYFVACDGGRFHLNSATPPLLTVVGAPNFGVAFYLVYNLGVATSVWGTITNKAAVTGKRYHAEGNGIINVNGAGETHLPGNVVGTKSFGGQYY